MSKSDVFVSFSMFSVFTGWRFGDTSPLVSGEENTVFDNTDTKTPKTPK